MLHVNLVACGHAEDFFGVIFASPAFSNFLITFKKLTTPHHDFGRSLEPTPILSLSHWFSCVWCRLPWWDTDYFSLVLRYSIKTQCARWLKFNRNAAFRVSILTNQFSAILFFQHRPRPETNKSNSCFFFKAGLNLKFAPFFNDL